LVRGGFVFLARSFRMKNLGLMLACGALAVVLSGAAAYAFPPFKAAFEEKYVKSGSPELQIAFKEAGCNTCHVKGAESKKDKNPYGAEIDKVLVGDIKERLKTEKEAVLKELETAFGKVEAVKTPAGKTWGEVIKAGQLP